MAFDRVEVFLEVNLSLWKEKRAYDFMTWLTGLIAATG